MLIFLAVVTSTKTLSAHISISYLLFWPWYLINPQDIIDNFRVSCSFLHKLGLTGIVIDSGIGSIVLIDSTIIH